MNASAHIKGFKKGKGANKIDKIFIKGLGDYTYLEFTKQGSTDKK